MADRPTWQQRDPFGEKILTGTFNWRDERLIKQIGKFIALARIDSRANVRRQEAVDSGRLLRSITWKTWNESGGDVQVFHAHYAYYSKFVELALGRGNPYIGLPPGIPARQWQPIKMPDGRKRKARPSIPTEMRKRARRFTTYVQDYFSFAGIAMMAYSMRTDQPHWAQVNRVLFSHGVHGANNWSTFR